MADDALIRERVQELTCALLDEQISDDEFRLLENLLLSDAKCRDTYLGCIQLHADLMVHFATPAAKAGTKTGSGSQIMSFLATDPSSSGIHSPSPGSAPS
jgi:hypothetical protein